MYLYKITTLCTLNSHSVVNYFSIKLEEKKIKVGTSYIPIIHMLVCLMVTYVSLRFCSIFFDLFFSLFFACIIYCFLILLSVQIYCEPLCCVFHFSYIFQLQNFHLVLFKGNFFLFNKLCL